jgi:uncharacterized membrane protein
VSTQPNQGNTADQNNYGSYSGYRPRKPADDPYEASPQWGSSSNTSSTQGSSQQSDPHYMYGQQRQQGQQQYTSSSNQQRQQAYVPPGSVTGRKSRSSWAPVRFLSNLKPNQAAFFSYLLVFFSGIFFLFYERKNRLVRFSAAQSIVLFLPLLIINSILQFIIGVVSSWFIVGPLFALLFGAVNTVLIIIGIVLWLVLMLQAYRGHELKLPVVGDYAERLLGLFTPRKRTN